MFETLNGWNEAYTQLSKIFEKVLQIIERIQLFIRLQLIYLKTIDTTNTTFANDTNTNFHRFGNDHNLLWNGNATKCFLFCVVVCARCGMCDADASKFIMHDIIRLAKRTFHHFRCDAFEVTMALNLEMVILAPWQSYNILFRPQALWFG